MWLSDFLSVPGQSVCTHEATEFAGSPEEFWSNANLYAAEVEAYGNSDSANIFVLPALLAERPMTRVIWVQRPIIEVARSMKAAKMPCEEGALQTLVTLRDKYRDYFDLVVDFEALEHSAVCRAVWELCLPKVPFDYGRWGMFASKQIGYSATNPFPRKQYAKFFDWVKRELYAASVVES